MLLTASHQIIRDESFGRCSGPTIPQNASNFVRSADSMLSGNSGNVDMAECQRKLKVGFPSVRDFAPAISHIDRVVFEAGSEALQCRTVRSLKTCATNPVSGQSKTPALTWFSTGVAALLSISGQGKTARLYARRLSDCGLSFLNVKSC
jgi:hypothetical protein